jgi:very-short-patch-repair endonuclease
VRRLALEVDGAAHNIPDRAHDLRRDAWLAAQGIRALRVPAA